MIRSDSNTKKKLIRSGSDFLQNPTLVYELKFSILIIYIYIYIFLTSTVILALLENIILHKNKINLIQRKLLCIYNLVYKKNKHYRLTLTRRHGFGP